MKRVTASAWIENSNRRKATVRARLLEMATERGGLLLVEEPVSTGEEIYLRFSFRDRASAYSFVASVDRSNAAALVDNEDAILRRLRARKAELTA